MIRRPPRSTRKESSAASDVYKRQGVKRISEPEVLTPDGLAAELVATSEEVLLVGDGADRYRESFDKIGQVDIGGPSLHHPSAVRSSNLLIRLRCAKSSCSPTRSPRCTCACPTQRSTGRPVMGADLDRDADLGHVLIGLRRAELRDVQSIRGIDAKAYPCLLYTSPSPRDATLSRMPSSA